MLRKIFNTLVAVPVLTALLATGASAKSLEKPDESKLCDPSGFFQINIAKEKLDTDAKPFFPKRDFMTRISCAHGSSLPWKSTTFEGILDVVNTKGGGPYGDGNGLLIHALNINFEGFEFAKGTRTDFWFGMPHKVPHGGTQAEKQKFSGLTPTLSSEEPVTALGLADPNLMGVGLSHEMKGENGDKLRLELDLLYREFKATRNVYFQDVKLADGQTADSPYPSIRAAFMYVVKLGPKTTLESGFTAMYLQPGRIDGKVVRSGQTSILPHLVYNHETDGGIKFRGFVEGGYVEDAGKEQLTGVFLDAHVQAIVPLKKDILKKGDQFNFTTAAHAQKMPETHSVFGNAITGMQWGIEYTVPVYERLKAGFAASIGKDYVSGGPNEGWKQPSQLLFMLQHNF